MKSWSEFERFEPVIDRFMPLSGEGETVASQVCTAVNKLVYKWYNDGDVFDNSYELEGWCNDLYTKEVQAESVAFTVCSMLGIDTSDYSFGYVAGWSKDKDVKELIGSMEVIRKTAGEMFDKIN